jgi:hypothetical protein
MYELLLRPSDRELQPTRNFFAARSLGMTRKTVPADAVRLADEFRKNTPHS